MSLTFPKSIFYFRNIFIKMSKINPNKNSEQINKLTIP